MVEQHEDKTYNLSEETKSHIVTSQQHTELAFSGFNFQMGKKGESFPPSHH